MTAIRIVHTDQEIGGVTQVELYFDTEFQASWNKLDQELSKGDNAKINSMMRRAIDYGEDRMKQKMRDLLGCK